MISAGPDEGITFSITRGETSDITAGLELIRTTRFSESHEYFAMDRGYSAYVTLDVCEDKKIVAVVPPKKTFKEPWEYHRWIYAYRNEIERLFGRLKHYRRSSTRFDKLIRRYAAFVTLGLIFHFLKTYVNSA
jgi:transposase